MKTTVNQFDFVRAFETADRANNFSRPARQALFDYLEECEKSTGEELELDVVALCCDWSEYETALKAANEQCDFDKMDLGLDDEDELEEAALAYLQDKTQVIVFDGGILVESF